MTIKVEGHNCKDVRVDHILYAYDNAIESIANELIEQVAEMQWQMLLDMPEEYETVEHCRQVFEDLPELALELVDEHIDNLRDSIKQRLNAMKTKSTIKALYYNDDGFLKDVDLHIKTSRETGKS